MKIIILVGLFVLNFSFHGNYYPPGTLPVKGKNNLYLDKSEVTNKDYRQYLYWLLQYKAKDSSEHFEALPDVKIWRSAYRNSNLLHDTKYENYPIVGVSYRQAINYCKWRTDIVIWRNIAVSEKTKRKLVYSLPDYSDYPVNTQQELIAGLYSTSSLKSKTFVGICDNAKEMTSKYGIAINNSLNKCLDTVHYSAPDVDIGFRCKATIDLD